MNCLIDFPTLTIHSNIVLNHIIFIFKMITIAVFPQRECLLYQCGAGRASKQGMDWIGASIEDCEGPLRLRYAAQEKSEEAGAQNHLDCTC